MTDAGNAPAATPTRTGNLELNVGRRRVSLTVTVPTVPVPPVRMLPLFQQIADKVMSMAVEQAAAAGHSVSCRKGCGACCRDLVPLAPLEARHIAAVVDALPEPRRSQVRQRFRDAVERLEAAGLAEALRNLADPASPDLRGGSVALDYFAQGIACPFLEEESCSIHAQRPIICREYLVVSPAELCALNRPEDVRAISAPLGSLERAVPAVGPRTVGPRWIPLVLALEYVAANPEDPGYRPGTELFEEFLSKLPPAEESEK